MLVMSGAFSVEACQADAQRVFDCEAAEAEFDATVLWTREDVPEQLLRAFLEQWQIGRAGLHRGIVEVTSW